MALNKAKQFRQGTKEYKSFPQYAKDFDLSSWNTLSLFDEYLEMGITNLVKDLFHYICNALFLKLSNSVL